MRPTKENIQLELDKAIKLIDDNDKWEENKTYKSLVDIKFDSEGGNQNGDI